MNKNQYPRTALFFGLFLCGLAMGAATWAQASTQKSDRGIQFQKPSERLPSSALVDIEKTEQWVTALNADHAGQKQVIRFFEFLLAESRKSVSHPFSLEEPFRLSVAMAKDSKKSDPFFQIWVPQVSQGSSAKKCIILLDPTKGSPNLTRSPDWIQNKWVPGLLHCYFQFLFHRPATEVEDLSFLNVLYFIYQKDFLKKDTVIGSSILGTTSNPVENPWESTHPYYQNLKQSWNTPQAVFQDVISQSYFWYQVYQDPKVDRFLEKWLYIQNHESKKFQQIVSNYLSVFPQDSQRVIQHILISSKMMTIQPLSQSKNNTLVSFRYRKPGDLFQCMGPSIPARPFRESGSEIDLNGSTLAELKLFLHAASERMPPKTQKEWIETKDGGPAALDELAEALFSYRSSQCLQFQDPNKIAQFIFSFGEPREISGYAIMELCSAVVESAVFVRMDAEKPSSRPDWLTVVIP